MIIGAGPNQLPAIKLAKQKGYRVAVTDYDPDAEGFHLADFSAVISTKDADKNIEYAKQLNNECRIDERTG